jgi:hypothetical protein
MALSEYAEWWDAQKRTSEGFLNEWVQDNPQWWAMAAAVQTSMDLGSGFVDVLRLGEGVAEGGWRGYGKDALRVLTILGPLGRAGGMVSRFAHVRMLRFAAKPVGMTGPCTFQAANNALTIVKGRPQNLFLTAQDAAKALGKPLAGLPQVLGKYKLAAWVDDLVPFLRSQGARIKAMTQPKTIAEVANLAKTENGVVIFAVKASRGAGEKPFLHSIIAVRDELGRVRFADYGGKLHNSVEELIRAKPAWGNVQVSTLELFVKNNAATVVEGMELTGLLENAMSLFRGMVIVISGVTAIETVEGTDLAVPVMVAAVPEPTKQDPAPTEVVKASFDAYTARKKGRPVVRLPELRITGHAPPRPDWLTGVQYRLNALGFGAGPVDGIAGPKTRGAVRSFQAAYPPLAVDGIPGPKTQSRLVQICGY